MWVEMELLELIVLEMVDSIPQIMHVVGRVSISEWLNLS